MLKLTRTVESISKGAESGRWDQISTTARAN